MPAHFVLKKDVVCFWHLIFFPCQPGFRIQVILPYYPGYFQSHRVLFVKIYLTSLPTGVTESHHWNGWIPCLAWEKVLPGLYLTALVRWWFQIECWGFWNRNQNASDDLQEKPAPSLCSARWLWAFTRFPQVLLPPAWHPPSHASHRYTHDGPEAFTRAVLVLAHTWLISYFSP